MDSGMSVSYTHLDVYKRQNLFNGFVYEDSPIVSTPYHLFASEYGAFFMEAVKLRYPEYTKMKNLYPMEK